MIYLFSKDEAKIIREAKQNFNINNFIPDEKKPAFYEIVDDLIMKKCSSFKSEGEVLEDIKKQSAAALIYIYNIADKSTPEALERDFNKYARLDYFQEIEETPTPDKIKTTGGRMLNSLDIESTFIVTMFTNHNYYLQKLRKAEKFETFTMLNKKIYSAMHEEIIKQPFVINDRPPHYFSTGTNALTYLGKLEGETQPGRNGTEKIKVRYKVKRKEAVIYAPIETIKKELGAALQVEKFNMYLSMLIVKAGIKEGNNLLDLTINYQDYINFTNETVKKTSYTKHRQNINKVINQLYDINIRYGEGKKTRLIYAVDNNKYKKAFTISLTPSYVNFLLKTRISPAFDILKLKGNDYYIAKKLTDYNNQPNNIAQQRANKIKVKNVLKHTPIISYERLKEYNPRKWREKIKGAFEKSLNNLVKKSFLIEWYYIDETGNIVNPRNIKTYHDFENLYLIFDPFNKIDHAERIENRRQKRLEATQKAEEKLQK